MIEINNLRFKPFKGGELRYDIEVDGNILAADVSKKYRNGRYVNVRLNPKGESWISRNYMFTGDPFYPFVHSTITISCFFIENNGLVRPVMKDKEKIRNRADKLKIATEWRPYALALHHRLGGSE
jgi:hypothetical protein